MKVSEYRDLMSSVSYWISSVVSAANTQERENEQKILKRSSDELRAAVCPRATERDKAKATSLLARADELTRT